MLHGVWIDDDVRLARTPTFWDQCKSHNFNVAALMLESVGDGFDPRYSVEDVEEMGKLARERDVEIVLTLWPEPRTRYLEELNAKIDSFVSRSGASGLESDLEGLWLPNRVKGYASLDAAGDHLVETLQKISARHDVRTEVTTYPFHAENTRTADVAPHVDRVLPQAYSVRNRDKGGKNWEVPWEDTFGPGGMQKLALGKAMQIPALGKPNGPMLSCGLAAYDQLWPGHLGEEAMRLAYRTALRYNPLEVRFWSSKWVFGARKNGYAARFMKSI